MMRIAVIADDLTGALDTVSTFAQRGLRMIVFTSPEAIEPDREAETEVIGVSTNSRHLPPHNAAIRATEAAIGLQSWKPETIIKKIDTRLKGNIAVEAEAIARVFGHSRLTVAPAAPDVGRFVIDGQVTGHGVETPIDIAPRFADIGLGMKVIDAASEDALDAAVRSGAADGETLIVCARGMAKALARLRAGPAANRPFVVREPVVLAIGSRDAVTTLQIDKLLVNTSFQTLRAERGKLEVPDAVAPKLLCQCTGDQVEPGDVVARRFAAGVAALVRRHGTRTLLLSGGDTAFAVLQELETGRIEVCGEIAPGLPWFTIPMKHGGVSVVGKSGGFGHPGTLLDIFRV